MSCNQIKYILENPLTKVACIKRLENGHRLHKGFITSLKVFTVFTLVNIMQVGTRFKNIETVLKVPNCETFLCEKKI